VVSTRTRRKTDITSKGVMEVFKAGTGLGPSTIITKKQKDFLEARSKEIAASEGVCSDPPHHWVQDEIVDGDTPLSLVDFHCIKAGCTAEFNERRVRLEVDWHLMVVGYGRYGDSGMVNSKDMVEPVVDYNEW